LGKPFVSDPDYDVVRRCLMSSSNPSHVIWAILIVLGMGLTACSSASTPQEPPGRATAVSESTPTEASQEPSKTVVATAAETDLEFAQILASLPDLGPAPDFTNEVWINTDAPLTLATLQGKVVLVEFWTYG
jgi:hypothetical protein